MCTAVAVLVVNFPAHLIRYLYREIEGVVQEPFEQLSVDIEDRHQGPVMEALGARGGDLSDMVPDGKGRLLIP